jgi:hypothetical protein
VTRATLPLHAALQTHPEPAGQPQTRQPEPSNGERWAEPLPMPATMRPALFLVVDTEEEFDWNAGFSRQATRVTCIREVARLQAVTARYGVKPTYVIDYPVATDPVAGGVFGALVDANACTIGAHLHPWVNPPFLETVCPANSYGCNLDPGLERRKIAALKEAIGDRFEIDARAYKAGRYGFGPSTARTLEALGFDVDLSVNPCMDFTADGGPSFMAMDARPSTFGRSRTLVEIPCSTGFVGVARTAGRALHGFASTPVGTRTHLPGVLARLGVLNKVMISPEGYTFDEMRALASQLYADGVRTFSLTLHSPSLAAGHTPYAATAGDVDRLLGTIDRFLEFFFDTLRGVPATPAGFYRQVSNVLGKRTKVPPGRD